MKYYNLDMIVRGVLFNKQYPIHWYAQFLKYGIDALIDLQLFHCGYVNSKLLTVSPIGTVTLPCDYVDYIRVGIPNGIYNKPLVSSSTFSNLYRYNDQGEKIKYDDIEEGASTSWQSAWYESYVNKYGESIGRWFNHDNNSDSYKVIKERGEIQLHPSIGAKQIILDYISDGISCDAATRVEPYMKKYLELYMDWQLKLHGRHYSAGDADRALNLVEKELRKVRATTDPLTQEDVRRIVRRSFTGTYKN